MSSFRIGFMCLVAGIVVSVSTAFAQTTAFTYQGNLVSGGSPASGNYDFEFKLFDLVSAGTQQGSTLQRLNVAVANGSFNVLLDFGAGVFPGSDRFLDIAVRPAGSGAFTLLSPRQKVSSVPYSVRSLNSTMADNAGQLGGVAANQYVLTGDPRMTDSRVPTPGSANYIQNQSAGPQASSSFNVSGNGLVGGTLSVGNSFTNARLYLNRGAAVPSNSSDLNFYSAGSPDFAIGTSQGSAAAADFSIYNYGTNSNVLTIQKSSGNVGIGTTAPGYKLHVDQTTPNAFASHIQTEGLATGSSYGLVVSAGTNSSDMSFQARNQAGTSLLAVRGNGNVGVGTTTPNFKFEVNSTQNNQFAASIRNLGSPTDASNGLLVRAGTSALDTAFETDDLGGNTLLRVKGNGFVGIGVNDATSRLHVVEPSGSDNQTALIQGGNYGLHATGDLVALSANAPGATFAVTFGGVQVGGFGLTTTGLSVSKNASITGTETVQGDATFNGRVIINNQPNGGIPVCYAYSSNFLTQCASSRRFKKNISDFSSGLDLIRSLRPVTFDWKSEDRHDIGLIAEEVETVEPLLTTHLKDGEIQGVRYDLIGVVLVNAVKEQQSQIETLQKQNSEMARQIAALKSLVCAANATAAVCKTADETREKR
jgi:Chaperone of endosialidase